MIGKLHEAKLAFGIGASFVVYAAWLFYDAWHTSRRNAERTRAKLIHDDAGSKRARLRQEEGID